MRLTSGYPYFLQIMGRSLRDALSPPRAEIDSAAVARAADADRDHVLMRGLRHEGFLWRDKLRQSWTCGIPTLAGCVIEYVNREYAPAVAAAKKTAKRQAGTMSMRDGQP